MSSIWNDICSTGSAEQTRAAGQALGRLLMPGDVVLLSGDLGAGKTQFVQGVARGLDAVETPVSPTFNIVLSYGSGRMALHHFDLYRLDTADQLEDIGLAEYLESAGACLVEWAEKFPEAFDSYLAIDFRKLSRDERLIRAAAFGERYVGLLRDWSESRAGLSGSGGPVPGSGDVPVGPQAAFPASEAVGGKPGRRSPLAREDEAGLQRACAPKGGPDGGRDAETGGDEPVPEAPAAGVSGVSGDEGRYVLALDTANEVVSIGIGLLGRERRLVTPAAVRQVAAHRASNTTLVPAIDALLAEAGVARSQLACLCAGRGPGSFTGVRIAMATAKGIASALGVGLVGVSSLDAVAWGAQLAGVRGTACVVADAMRKEVYPVRYRLSDDGADRLGADRVVKADALAGELEAERRRVPGEDARSGDGTPDELLLLGDGLVKYRELLEPFGRVLSDKLWEVSGAGLLAAFEHAWRQGEADPFDAARHDPAFALPVYTRLSDAEENERVKLAKTDEKNLVAGVQDVAPDGGVGRATMHSQAHLTARADDRGASYRPLDAACARAVADLEQLVMGTDAWNERMVAGELGRRDRCWWVAEREGRLAGYAGGLVVDGDLQVLKVAVLPELRRHGIARELFMRLAEDARNLGASTCSLEVRLSNEGAQAFYASLGLASVGVRPRYYSDREDAAIMSGPLPERSGGVAGMELQHLDTGSAPDRSSWRPAILAIESSCDETAASVADGSGRLLSDVVASQIDFHARFGGVVPEIASRKHIEAICGVCAEALDCAGTTWRDLDAVAVTYAPGLLGALVVGVAFAKGAAWALDVPFIGVNHLEGHLYANKVGCPGFSPPAVVSLVSGGNTMLVHMRDWGDYEVLGATIDDAVGEAFDKVSKALGLGYPGGPVISARAASGDPGAIAFPRAMLHSHDLRFSLSGLKTAVVNYINGERAAGRALNVADIAASFQQAVVDVQVAKAKAALEQTGAPAFCLGGGVAANPALRQAYERLCGKMGVRLVMPPLSSCGDNAGMIALVALDRFRAGKFFPLDADAQAHANLEEPY